MDHFKEWLKTNLVGVSLIGLGVTSMGVGVAQMVDFPMEEEVIVEGVEEGGTGEVDKLVVDVAGAVKNPGIYNLEEGSRLAQAIEMAGGFGENADAAWVAKMVNLAEAVRDGQKIYIPNKDEENNEQKSENIEESKVAGVVVVNVNTADKSELESLWGIGEARAEAIISNRPYSSFDELLNKASIPANVLEKNEGKISIY